MVRFLSDTWLARANELARALHATDTTVVVQQTVRGPGHGTLTYHLTLGTDGATFAAGPAAEPDLVLTQDYDTAAAINRGDLRPADAFAEGRVKVRGNLRVLAEHRDLLTTTNDVFATLRAETEYE